VSFNIPQINVIRGDLPVEHLTRLMIRCFGTPYKTGLEDQGERQI
jgi:hypothetical protein